MFIKRELERIAELIENEGGVEGESVLYKDYDLYVKVMGALAHEEN